MPCSAGVSNCFILIKKHVPESTCFPAFNHYLLIARYYIYVARYKSETPKLEIFIVRLETKIYCEREIAKKKKKKTGNYTKYRNKWTSLRIPDTRCDFLT